MVVYKPVLDQPSAEEVQKFFDENFRIIHVDSVKYRRPNWGRVVKFPVTDTAGKAARGFKKVGVSLN